MFYYFRYFQPKGTFEFFLLLFQIILNQKKLFFKKGTNGKVWYIAKKKTKVPELGGGAELQNVNFFTQINSFQMNLPKEKAHKSLRFFDLKCIKWAKKANFRSKLPKMISLTLF